MKPSPRLKSRSRVLAPRSSAGLGTAAVIGVRYVGFLAENSGFGQATRLHLHSLAQAGVPVCGRSVLMGPQAPGDVQVSAARYPTTARICAQRRAYDHVLLHVVPLNLSVFREPGCRNIGITVWGQYRPASRLGRALGSRR